MGHVQGKDVVQCGILILITVLVIKRSGHVRVICYILRLPLNLPLSLFRSSLSLSFARSLSLSFLLIMIIDDCKSLFSFR